MRNDQMTRAIAARRARLRRGWLPHLLRQAAVIAIGALAHVAMAATPAGWSEAQIRASWKHSTAPAAAAPAAADSKLDLFIFIEDGGRQLSVRDTKSFDTVRRIESRRTLRGEPLFSPDGRHAYLAADDGWIVGIDLRAGHVVAEVRAGSGLSDLALSSDGRWLLAGTEAPHRLVLFDHQLDLVKSWPAASRDGLQTSRIAEIHEVAPRRSFVVAMRDIAELWLISHDPRAEDFYEGLVHDFRMGEGVPTRGFHNARRISLPEALRGLHFKYDGSEAIGSSARAAGDASIGHVVNLDVRRRIATLAVGGEPQFDAGISFMHDGRRLLAAPRRDRGGVVVIDTRTWSIVKEIPTARPGRRLRTHADAALAWVEGVDGDARPPEAIDKRSLEVVSARHAMSAAALQFEFGADPGQLLAIMQTGSESAVSVLDARTLAPLRRIVVKAPVGLAHLGQRLPRSPGQR